MTPRNSDIQLKNTFYVAVYEIKIRERQKVPGGSLADP